MYAPASVVQSYIFGSIKVSMKLPTYPSLEPTLTLCVMYAPASVVQSYIFGPIKVSMKLPTYPSLEPTLTLFSHLEQNVGLGER